METTFGYVLIGIISLLLGFVLGLNFNKWSEKEPPMIEDFLSNIPKSYKDNWEKELDDQYKASILDREPLRHPYPSDFELKRGDEVRLSHPIHCLNEDGEFVSVPVDTVCIIENLWYDDQYANKKAVKVFIPVIKRYQTVDLSFIKEV